MSVHVLRVIARNTHTVKLIKNSFLFHQNGNRQKYFVEVDCKLWKTTCTTKRKITYYRTIQKNEFSALMLQRNVNF